MQQTFYTLLVLFLLIGCIFLGFKCFELYQKYLSERFKTPLANFISDLYRLQIKWAKNGEFGYSKSIANIIEFHVANVEAEKNKPGNPNLPLTNDSLATSIQLNKINAEEIRNQLEEMLEFKG